MSSIGHRSIPLSRLTAELGADISTLRISSIMLRSRKRILVDFDGPDVDVYWSCEYADGTFSGLDFDS